MASTESFDDLEQRVSGLVESALGEVKDELLEKLQAVRERLEELVGSEVAAAREEALAAAEAAALEAEKVAAEAAVLEAEKVATEAAAAAQVAAAAEADLIAPLYDSVAAIDRARSQSDVLQALLTGSMEFATRSALFLTREDGLQGWASRGFETSEEDFQQLHLDYSEGSTRALLAQGRGAVELSEEDCGEFCSQIDASQAQAGVLIPLVLRDRLAAALYADHAEQGDRVQVTALQLLTYVAAQALETLPLRERGATPTLRLVSDAPAEEPSLEFWQFAVPAVPEIEPTEEILEEPVPVPAEPEQFEAEEAWEEPIEVSEPEPVELQPAEESGFAVEEAAPEAEPAESFVAAEEAVSEPEPAWEPPPVIEEPVEVIEEEVAVEEITVETAPEAIEEMPLEEPAVEIAPAVEEPAFEAVAEPTPEAPTEIPPPAEVAPPPAAAAAHAEVAPPEDIDGPGWAFTTRQFTTETGEDAAHEEARRLARLLVTEIKLYNEEQVEEGRQNRNIYQSLRDDIDRSRQIYEERIAESVRLDTDYFREELVRILAAGDAEILGI